MSWLISLMLAGAVLTSGNNISSYEYQNTATNDLTISKNASFDETENFEKTYPFNPNGKIEVSNLNGSIYIEAWDRPEISLSATKVANTKERLSDVEIKINADQNSFSVKTDYKAWRNRGNNTYENNGKLYVTFRLKVPRTAFLNEIETVNGSVDVSNMTNYTEISAVNGAIKASNLRGNAKLSTVNGTVYADFDNLNDDSSISLGTVNGTVRLSIPSNTNATIKANTVNGSISNEFGLPIRKGKYVGRDLYGKIGSGNVKIKLSSVNGGLSINNKDGGTTNPAINLLQQKTSDDFDDSFDSDMGIEVAKINVDVARVNADVARAVKEAEAAVIVNQKATEKAIKEAAKINSVKLKEALDAVKIDKEVQEQMERVQEDLAKASEAFYISRRSPYIQEKSDSFEVKGTPLVVVDAEDCNVLVRGWDKQEVKYVISKVARGITESSDVRTKVSKDKSKVEIEVANDSDRSEGLDKMTNMVRIEVFVPKKSNLRVTSHREIRLEGVSGELELHGMNESINVRDSYGKLKIESIEGTIRIIGFDGELEAVSEDADMYLEGDFKKINSTLNDGKVFLTLSDETNALITTANFASLGKTEIAGDKMKIDGLEVTKLDKQTWRVGKGGYAYNFDLTDGKLFVRSKSSLIQN